MDLNHRIMIPKDKLTIPRCTDFTAQQEYRKCTIKRAKHEMALHIAERLLENDDFFEISESRDYIVLSISLDLDKKSVGYPPFPNLENIEYGSVSSEIRKILFGSTE